MSEKYGGFILSDAIIKMLNSRIDNSGENFVSRVGDIPCWVECSIELDPNDMVDFYYETCEEN